jgi:hypothetical protein
MDHAPPLRSLSESNFKPSVTGRQPSKSYREIKQNDAARPEAALGVGTRFCVMAVTVSAAGRERFRHRNRSISAQMSIGAPANTPRAQSKRQR